MKLGVTASRRGLTDAQKKTARELIAGLQDLTEMHHGCCVGGDCELADITLIVNSDTQIIAHPGQSARSGDNEWLDQPHLGAADEVRPTKTHFARNRDIVNETDLLVACPGEKWDWPEVPKHGGTAYTVWYATHNNRPVWVIYPDGTFIKSDEVGS